MHESAVIIMLDEILEYEGRDRNESAEALLVEEHQGFVVSVGKYLVEALFAQPLLEMLHDVSA